VTKDIRPIKKPIPLIPRGSLPEKVEEKDPRVNWLTQVYLGKWPLNRSSSGSDSSSSSSSSPIPQIDIISAMMIVWKENGKNFIRFVLCNIVCESCAQCNVHTYEQT